MVKKEVGTRGENGVPIVGLTLIKPRIMVGFFENRRDR